VHINTNKYVNRTYPRLQANGGVVVKTKVFFSLKYIFFVESCQNRTTLAPANKKLVENLKEIN
jgi:hypothetical protein